MKRNRGGVISVIGETKTPTISITTSTASTVTTNEKRNQTIDCSKTLLVKGDILRVTVEKWIAEQFFGIGGGNVGFLEIKYYTDPEGILDTAKNYNKPGAEDELFQRRETNTFEINIPFEIKK